MILDTTLKLEGVLASAITSSQPEVHVDYVDWNPNGEQTPPATFRVAMNSTTDVIILAAPVGNPKREPVNISIYNKDTVPITVTVKTDDGTTERIIFKKTVEPGGTVQYNKAIGWFREAVV